jgi:bifunctional non-homologous end joining protein LigD
LKACCDFEINTRLLFDGPAKAAIRRHVYAKSSHQLPNPSAIVATAYHSRRKEEVVTRFIEPCFPVTRASLPKGPEWLHEIKFDGYRVQLHKDSKRIKIYSRRGADFTKRYPPVAEALAELPMGTPIVR